MSWLDTLLKITESLPADKVAELVNAQKTDNETIAQVTSLLNQVQRNPGSADQVATTIIGMRGVPGVVRDMVQNLPLAAKDPTGMALVSMITQINAQMVQRRGWF